MGKLFQLVIFGVTPGKTYDLSIFMASNGYAGFYYSSEINKHEVDVEDY